MPDAKQALLAAMESLKHVACAAANDSNEPKAFRIGFRDQDPNQNSRHAELFSESKAADIIATPQRTSAVAHQIA
jgi:hypothetical protein